MPRIHSKGDTRGDTFTMRYTKEKDNKKSTVKKGDEEETIVMCIYLLAGRIVIPAPNGKEWLLHSFGAHLKNKYPDLHWCIENLRELTHQK